MMPRLSRLVAGLCAGLCVANASSPYALSSFFPSFSTTVSSRASLSSSSSGVLAHATSSSTMSFPRDNTKSEKRVISLTSYGAPIIEHDGKVEVTARITNTKNTELRLSHVSFYAQRRIPSTANAALAFLRGETHNLALYEKKVVGTSLAPGSSTDISFSLPRSMFPSQWGPRGMEIRASLGDEEFTDRNFLIFAPSTPVQKIPVTVTIPITAQYSQSLVEKNAVQEFKDLFKGSEQTPTHEPSQSPSPKLSHTPTGESSRSSSHPSQTLSPSAVSSPTESSSKFETSQGKKPILSAQSLDYLTTMALPGVTIAIDPLLMDNKQDAEAIRRFAAVSGTHVLVLPAGDLDIAPFAHTQRADFPRKAIEKANQVTTSLGPQASSNIFFSSQSFDDVTADFVRSFNYGGFLVSDADARLSSSQVGTGTVYLSSQQASSRNSSGAPKVIVSSSLMSSALSGVLPTEKQANALNPSNKDYYSTNSDSLPLNSDKGRQLALALSAISYQSNNTKDASHNIVIDREDVAWAGPKRSHNSSLSPQVLAKNVNILLSAPWLEPTPLPSVLQSPTDTIVPLNPNSSSSSLNPSQLNGVFKNIENIEHFASSLDHFDLIQEKLNDYVGFISSVSLRSHTKERAKLLTQVRSLSDYVQRGLTVDQSSTVNVISEKTDFPVHVKNSLPTQATVFVHLHSPDYRLVSDAPVKITIPPASTVTASLPITARGSGNINILVSLETQDGRTITRSTEIKVRLRAHWENTGIIIVGVATVALFVFGISRSLRRGRRSPQVNPDSHLESLRSDTSFPDNDAT
ncbi:DUF6049 family protein [Actinotignum urinale]|uniref:DUF6049 family protein n=2 Tax=Actinotignum urinale TaxID=190146 RepID=A0AAW9HNJ6_9ACTO|nr:DUF6049 family protein [Actinotignum urinale]MDY5155466.1 DUF6049 family protein [Actinotignum urinale]MDY5160507.1 DUF6049 family protein [Actinotignum urinale]